MRVLTRVHDIHLNHGCPIHKETPEECERNNKASFQSITNHATDEVEEDI
ncbi:hypothetical protein KFK09_022608 [Dendrobium nobile]|uniref:Uncharacterized protein n=1 Tax=Dendrobium nobile TaxID=94219 RepID=A0A8T3AJU9_DENNO|nr:hypothetical protein KFK09_022608 [Dendrobium nobile]